MANLALLMPLIEKWEGGYAYDPDDRAAQLSRGSHWKHGKKQATTSTVTASSIWMIYAW